MLLTKFIVLMVYSKVTAVCALALVFDNVTDAATACADLRSTVRPTVNKSINMTPTSEPSTR